MMNMKVFVFFAIMILGFFSAITAAVKPEIVEQKYQALRAPLDQHFSEDRANKWKEAKEQALAVWMLKQPIPADCRNPKTAIREVECKNTKQLLAQAFERNWSDKVDRGWKPEGVEE